MALFANIASLVDIRFLIAAILLFIGVFALVSVILGAKHGDNVSARLNEIRTLRGDSLDVATAAANTAKVRKPLTFKFIRIPDAVRKTITESGIPLRAEEFVMVWIIITCLPSALYYFIGKNMLISILIAAVCAALPPVYVSMSRKKLIEAFEGQLGDALMLMSNSLRAGFSFEQAFEVAAKDSADPLSGEFMRALREMRMGVPLEQALTSIGERTGSMNMKLLTSAVIVQRQVGGNLADILDGISTTIRERIEMKKNVKTLTAQGRFSGLIIGVLPIALFLLISVINPEYMGAFTETLLGKLLLVVAFMFEGVGAIVIKKMVSIEV